MSPIAVPTDYVYISSSTFEDQQVEFRRQGGAFPPLKAESYSLLADCCRLTADSRSLFTKERNNAKLIDYIAR